MKKKQLKKEPEVKKIKYNSFIFSKYNREIVSDSSILYTIINQHDFIDEDNNPRKEQEDSTVYAKKITKNNSIKYFIKIDNTNKFYNPLSSVSSIRPTKILQTISIPKNQFKQVNSEIFNMYINFLRSKNEAWLHNAEREGY